MKKTRFCLINVILSFLILFSIENILGSSPAFTINNGQVDFKATFCNQPIDFTLQSPGMNLYFTKSGIIYQLISPKAKPIDKFSKTASLKTDMIDNSYSCFVYEMKFVNPNLKANWEVENETTSFSNYYLPSCPNGLTEIKSYKKITLRNIYPNIDWEISTNEKGIKYNMIVHPGGDPAAIQFVYNYADKVSIENENIKIETQLGNIIEHAPVSFNPNNSKVNCKFNQSENKFNYQLANYNTKVDLIIDPGVSWSTYFGGAAGDNANGIRMDVNGNVIICGNTNSSNGIFHGGFQQVNAGNIDAFLAKFDSTGNLLWSTYFGGTQSEQVYGCDVDPAGNIYLAMNTSSDSGIAYNGFQINLVLSRNAFLVKFDSQGSRVWATYFGSGDEGPTGGVVVDHSNNLYLFGYSASDGLGTIGAEQIHNVGSFNGFIAKFDSSGSRIWCTYLGGHEADGIDGACIDSNNNLFVSGQATSTSLFYNGFKDSISGGEDNFLAKYDSNGNKIWGTYYGGSQAEAETKCATDFQQNVYLIGSTTSNDQISFNGFQNSFHLNPNIYEGYMVKFDSNGNRLWASYIGGNNFSTITDCSITGSNSLLVCGSTESDSDFAYLPFKKFVEGRDAFIAEFDPSGNRLWATYFGGPNSDEGGGCTSDLLGNIYLTGETGSTIEIAYNAYQDSMGGFGDAFVTKFNCSASTISPAISGDLSPDIFGQYLYTIDTTGVLDYFWEITGGQLISGQGTDSVFVHWNSVGTETINCYAMYSPGCYTLATMDPLVNTVHQLKTSLFQVYPNPFAEQIYFSAENIREIRMTDVLSRTFVLMPIENRINTQSTPSGVYLLTAVDYLGRIVGSTKVIK